MTREKTKGIKKIISFRSTVVPVLEEMMATDLHDSYSVFINYLIVEEKKRRDEAKNRKPVGRPKKEQEEEPEDYDWEGPIYYHPGKMLNQEKGELVTKSVYESYYLYRNLPIPDKPDKLEGH